MKKIVTLLCMLILALSTTVFASDMRQSTIPNADQNQFTFVKLYNGQTYYVVNCRQSITLREAPSVYAAEITQIPLGAPVTFLNNVGNGFYRINYDGLIGFALASYLAPAGY